MSTTENLNAGQGYFFFAESAGLILDIEGGMYADQDGQTQVNFQLDKGGNIVGNPYSQSLALDGSGTGGVYIVQDSTTVKTYEEAAIAGWVEADIYRYDGALAGYSQVNCTDTGNNFMEPWIGYWVRLKINDASTYEIRFTDQ